ncbi:hypothetical protein V2J09_001999 [Rumex salicifolius]
MEEKIKELESENQQLKDQIKEMKNGKEKLNEQLKTLQADLEIIMSKQKEVERVKEDMNKQIQEYRVQVTELESRLNESMSLQSDLEEVIAERESLTGRCADQERRAKATHETSLELKELIQSSHSRVEDSNRRVSEFEKTLKMEKSRINEFEVEIERLEEKSTNTETENQKYADLVSELSAELDKSRLTISRLQKKLEISEKDDKAAEKLSCTEDKLEEEIAKTTNLESAEANLIQGTDNKLKEVVGSFKNKESEMKSLYEKLEVVKEQLESYKIQATESVGKSVSLKEELNGAFQKVGHLEELNEEMKRLREEAEQKAAKSVQENELLIETNLNLSNKVFDLQHQLEDATAELDEDSESRLKKLKSELAAAIAEKDDVVEQLASEKQRFQNELSSITDKKQDLVERNVNSQAELQILLTKLEQQVKEYKGMNEALKDELEKLTLEEAQNFASRARAKELEEKLKVIEANMNKGVESQDEDEYTSIEKKEDNFKLESEQGSGNKQAYEDLEFKCQQVVQLEMQVKELQQQLQGDESGESVDERDIGSVTSSPTKRKKKNSGSPVYTTVTSHTNLKLIYNVGQKINTIFKA